MPTTSAGGSFVFISSTAAQLSFRTLAGCCAGKAALDQLDYRQSFAIDGGNELRGAPVVKPIRPVSRASTVAGGDATAGGDPGEG